MVLIVDSSQWPPVWEIAVHLAIAGDVFVLSFFPQDVLDEIWDLIESVSEGFPTYSTRNEIVVWFLNKI